MHSTYINLMNLGKQNNIKRQALSEVRWSQTEQKLFCHHIMCYKCNTAWILINMSVCHICNDGVVRRSISQSMPDDPSPFMMWFQFFLLLFYLKWSSAPTVQDILHNPPLILRQCHFITYQIGNFRLKMFLSLNDLLKGTCMELWLMG